MRAQNIALPFIVLAAGLIFQDVAFTQNTEAMPKALDAPFASAKRVPSVSGDTPVTEPAGDAELLPELRGIVVKEIESARGGGKADASFVVFEVYQNEPTQSGEAAASMAAFLGEPLSLDQIGVIRVALVKGWQEDHGEVIRVAVPPQDITEGVLNLQVIRARLGDVRVKGASHFDESDYLGAMRNAPGQTIDIDQLTNDIDWLERNPYRNVSALLERGDGFGETDIVLTPNEKRPWQIFAGYDREGTELLGTDRWFFGGNHGNLFGKGHRGTYQYFTDIEFENSHGHFASYHVPLPWRHEIQVSGFYSESSVSFDSGLGIPGLETFDNDGQSWQASLDYIIPLPRFYGAKQDLIFGFDSKSSDSNLDFGEVSLFETQTETYHFRGEWRIRRYDRNGATAARARIVASPGDWSGNNSDAAYEASRAGADSSYVYGGLEMDRQTNLFSGFTLDTDVAWHNASSNQLASEQLVLSGDGAVRGFERSRIRADNGFLFTAQLNSPAIQVGQIFEMPAFVKPFGFFDYGTGQSIDLLPGEPDDVDLSSAGLGFKTELDNRISGTIQYAWQLNERGFDDGEDGRFHIGLTTTW